MDLFDFIDEAIEGMENAGDNIVEGIEDGLDKLMEGLGL